jgi:hypothetical protein
LATFGSPNRVAVAYGVPILNQFGLSRDIPDPVKREVRQACGFGCVICGASIIEYEHVDPPFAEATTHDPARIALLCPQCHAKVTTGFLSKATVIEAMRDPISKRTGYASEFLDIGKQHPKVVFAGVTLTNCQMPVVARGLPLFMVQQAEAAEAPFRLSANFFNSQGRPSLQVVENEWRVSEKNWDVEATGGRIIVRDAPRHISLRLVAGAADALIVEELDMFLAGIRFIGSPTELRVEYPGGGGGTFTKCVMDGCRVGLMLG